MIQKLRAYGIKRDLLKSVHFFLSERRQRFVLGDIASNVIKLFGKLVKNFTCLDVDLWKQLYISIVRQYL